MIGGVGGRRRCQHCDEQCSSQKATTRTNSRIRYTGQSGRSGRVNCGRARHVNNIFRFTIECDTGSVPVSRVIV